MTQEVGVSGTKTVLVLTYHFVTNHGAVLQTEAVCRIMRAVFPSADIRVVDYRNWRQLLQETLKLLRFPPGAPLFYWSRALLFRRYIRRSIFLTKRIRGGNEHVLSEIEALEPNVFVVGSDVVWRLSKRFLVPRYPNPYFPTETASVGKRVALAASSIGSDEGEFTKFKRSMLKRLNQFSFILYRDDFTARTLRHLQESQRSDTRLQRLVDPTILQHVCIHRRASSTFPAHVSGKRSNEVVLLFPGRNSKVRTLVDKLRRDGFRIVGLSMYSPYVDVNLGHRLDPRQWAVRIANAALCVSDRFHGCVYAILAGTPVIGLETRPRRNDNNHMLTKKGELLTRDFRLPECLIDISDDSVSGESIYKTSQNLLKTWQDGPLLRIEEDKKRLQATGDQIISLLRGL